MDTTGLSYFTECHKHSAKARKYSATTLPSVAHGEEHTAFKLTAKQALPSAISRTLGKVLPCARSHSATKSERDGRPGNVTGERVGMGQSYNKRGGQNWWEWGDFAERHKESTRQRFKFCQVLASGHSANFHSLPSAFRMALGKL